MRSGIEISTLVPPGFAVVSVSCDDHAIVVVGRAKAEAAICPLCGAQSRRVHSCYIRQVADLPSAGRAVRFRLVTRRFVCDTPCPLPDNSILLAEPRFILEPDLNRGVRRQMVEMGVQGRREVFLNAAMVSAS